MRGFGIPNEEREIRNPLYGMQNPEIRWNPGCNSVEPVSLESGINDSGSGIQNRWSGIWNSRVTWIPLHRATPEIMWLVIPRASLCNKWKDSLSSTCMKTRNQKEASKIQQAVDEVATQT